MNLIDNRTEFERQILAIREKDINGEVFAPYFDEITEFIAKRVQNRFSEMNKSLLNPMDVALVIGEHFRDTYNASIEDTEFLVHAFFQYMIIHTEKTAQVIMEKAIPILVNEYDFTIEDCQRIFCDLSQNKEEFGKIIEFKPKGCNDNDTET